MEIYKILSEIMENRNLKISDIARICNLPDSTVRGIKKRKQDIKNLILYYFLVYQNKQSPQ